MAAGFLISGGIGRPDERLNRKSSTVQTFADRRGLRTVRAHASSSLGLSCIGSKQSRRKPDWCRIRWPGRGGGRSADHGESPASAETVRYVQMAHVRLREPGAKTRRWRPRTCSRLPRESATGRGEQQSSGCVGTPASGPCRRQKSESWRASHYPARARVCRCAREATFRWRCGGGGRAQTTFTLGPDTRLRWQRNVPCIQSSRRKKHYIGIETSERNTKREAIQGNIRRRICQKKLWSFIAALRATERPLYALAVDQMQQQVEVAAGEISERYCLSTDLRRGRTIHAVSHVFLLQQIG